ncbi:MAG: flagellar filament capping protein FliD [Rubrivivax sp.]|nr:flagellar filament capping protein FliD [Rubrivivax sp.]
MAAITSLGIGSGIDINSMVSQLVAIERRPIEQMQRDVGKLQTQVSSLGRLQSLFAALQDSANKLTGTSLWQGSKATSSNDAAVAVVGGSTAAPGNYAVSVSALASGQTAASTATFSDSGALVGSGTLTLAVGGWAGNVFTAKSGTTPVNVSVSAGDSIQTLRDKINAANAGVTASLVTDASGVRLALRSSLTGELNAFRVTAADDDGTPNNATGLSAFVYDPANAPGSMVRSQAASDAQATVNGIAVRSATNELSGTIEGMTLRLRNITAQPVDVAVAADREEIGKAVRDFAEAYSNLAKQIADQTKYDASSKARGPLQGDSTVNGLMSQLRAVINTPSGATPAFSRLSDIGLELQRDGGLTVNAGKLDNAMRDLPALRLALANSDVGTPGNDGFARRYSQLATQVLGVDGSLTQRTEGLRTQITRSGENQQRLEDRVERFRARLVQQYTAMDTNLSRLNALSNYVNQQVAAMNRPQQT